MLHLTWTKGNSDEGKGVQSHVVDCYKQLFLSAPSNSTKSQKASIIADNLMSLTFGASVADLASLEKLLSGIILEGLIEESVVESLWRIYSTTERIEKRRRRAAVVILGMLALSRSDIVVRKLDLLLSIGLGNLGQEDLLLAKFSCIALNRAHPSVDGEAKGTGCGNAALHCDHPIIQRLIALTWLRHYDVEWSFIFLP